MLNNIAVKPEQLSLRHRLSVACPRCGAQPKKKCMMSTGHPSNKTHLNRDLAAAKVGPPENFGLAFLRMLKLATSRGLRTLFQHK
jgi:hypothetical protein